MRFSWLAIAGDLRNALGIARPAELSTIDHHAPTQLTPHYVNHSRHSADPKGKFLGQNKFPLREINFRVSITGPLPPSSDVFRHPFELTAVNIARLISVHNNLPSGGRALMSV
jgi:hypothetical protein